MNLLSIKELLKKIGLWAASFIATIIAVLILNFVLRHFSSNETVVVGMLGISVFYFWGIYFLKKHGWSKALGIILFLLAVFFNFVLVSSPYKTASEFKSTRIFLLPLFLASIFLIMRQSRWSRLFGMLLIILTIMGAFMGAIFFSAGLAK